MAYHVKLSRVDILNPLRALAALAVAWFHFTCATGFVKTEWLRASGSYGELGVHVFFVISGFVVPYSMYRGGYRLGRDFGRFIAKRLVRLEPPYLASIVLIVTLWYLSALSPWFAGDQPDFSTAQVLLHLGYLNTLFGYPWLQPVYWTLGIEFQYYFFVALIYPLLIAPRPILRWLAVGSLAITPFLVQTPMFVFHYLGLFTLGMLAFQYHAALLPGKFFVPAIVLVSAMIGLCQNVFVGVAGGATALAIAFAPPPRCSSMRIFVFLGGISYSVYLLHVPIGCRMVNLGARFGSGLAWELVVLTVAGGVSIAASVGFSWIFEQTAQRLSSRITYGSTETPCTPASSNEEPSLVKPEPAATHG